MKMKLKFSIVNRPEFDWTSEYMGTSIVYSAHLDALALEIRRSWQYKMLQELSVYRKSTGEKETDMLKRFLEVRNAGVDLPEEWQRGIHMSWPHCAPNDFNVDLQIQRVNIC
jgi:hypothetical protein